MNRPVFLLPITIGSSIPGINPGISVSNAETDRHAFSHTVNKVVTSTETFLSMNSGQIPAERASQEENNSNELGIKISNVISLADGRKFQCTQCQSRFKRLDHLSGHMRIHTGEKPYMCELCDYRSSQKSKLKRHMGIHSDEKPFKCELCDYRSNQQGNLKRHMRIHTRKKP